MKNDDYNLLDNVRIPLDEEYVEERTDKWMIIIGILLCCTIVGSIIGIPILLNSAKRGWDKEAKVSKIVFWISMGIIAAMLIGGFIMQRLGIG